MKQVAVGQPAPSFRLPSAQGGEVGLVDYAGRRNVILFFAKGMACGFCRQKMSQLARGAPRFQTLDADIVMIAPTRPERGRFYAKNFRLPFPYLCDPDYRVYEAYGMPVREHSLLWKGRVLTQFMRMPKAEVTDLGPAKPSLAEYPQLFNDDDLGLFVADKTGTLRYASRQPYVEFEGTKALGMPPLPSTDEIVAVLEACERDPRAAVNNAELWRRGRISCSRKSMTAFEKASFWSPATMWAAPPTSTMRALGILARKSRTPSSVTTSLSLPRTSSVGTWMFAMAAWNRASNFCDGTSVRPWSRNLGSQCQYQRPSRRWRSTFMRPAGFTRLGRCGV